MTVASCDGDAEYTPEELAKHKTKASRTWVSYKDDVYDITDFIEQHPGGASKIQLAAGAAIDPYWALYQQHNNVEVKKILSRFRIGKLKRPAGEAAPVDAKDPYSTDPARAAFFKVAAAKPFNAEPPLPLLAGTFHTPNEAFFVRNHLPVPAVDPDQYALTIEVEGRSGPALTLRLSDLQTRFPHYAVVSSLQCAGNRRGEMIQIKPIKGLDWNAGAISNAQWTGVLLRDVLEAAGLNEADIESGKVRHVQFQGLDRDMTGSCYGSSIPVDKAWDKNGDVLLALTMNGQTLPRDHGYPVRVIAPGIVGARSVKWVDKIVVSPKESDAHWQQKDYKGFQPATDWGTVQWDAAPAIQDMPVTSAILEPTPDAAPIADDEVTVKGYAWSGNGRSVVRVDVSADGGHTWTTAALDETPTGRVPVSASAATVVPVAQWPSRTSTQGPLAARAWAWTQWHASVPITDEMRARACASTAAAASTRRCQLELISRAVDSAYNTQPDSVAPIWNLRGVVNNAWHRVSVEVAPPAPK